MNRNDKDPAFQERARAWEESFLNYIQQVNSSKLHIDYSAEVGGGLGVIEINGLVEVGGLIGLGGCWVGWVGWLVRWGMVGWVGWVGGLVRWGMVGWVGGLNGN